MGRINGQEADAREHIEAAAREHRQQWASAYTRDRSHGVWLQRIYGFENAINPYWPSIIGGLLYLLLIWAILADGLAQISDILNPTSAAEAQRAQFALTLFHTTNHFTWNWLLNLALTVGVWGFLLWVVILINIAQAKYGPNPPPLLRHKIVRWMDGDGPIESRFLRLVIGTWLLGSLWPLISIGSLVVSQHLHPGHPELVDYHGLAMVGTIGLLGLLSMAITQWRLGVHADVGWLLALLPWLPVVVLIGALFSPWSWTEGGKGVLNRPSGQRTPTLALLSSRSLLSSSGKGESVKAPGSVLRRINHSGPLVIVCASGGGSRAALFTAGIFSRIWWQKPLDGLPNNHALTALSTEDRSLLQDRQVNQNPAESPATTSIYPGRILLQHADVISSVSGGSLASSYFVESLYRQMRATPAPQARAERTTHNSTLLVRNQALAAFFNPQGFSGQEARPPLTWYDRQSQPQNLSAFFDPTAHDSAHFSEEDQQGFEANPYINAMRQDHLAACMSGFFMPWIGRGPGIEEFWQQRFRWYDERTKHPRLLTDLFPCEQDGRLPALILNSTLSRTGTRLAITNLDTSQFEASYKYGPPVSRSDLGEGDVLQSCASAARSAASAPKEAVRRAEERYDPLPAQINTLNELDPYWNIPLTTATRASANFPGGFALMRFVRRLQDSSEVCYNGGPDILEISDGGLIDNTGLDSVIALLRAHRDEIRQRGVLILQIDSGELPRNPGPALLDPLLHHLTEVKNALWRANLNTQAALESLYLDTLCQLFQEGQKDLQAVSAREKGYILGYETPRFAFYKVRAGETGDEHVMTSWHLDAPQRRLLYTEVEAPQQGEAILHAAEWLMLHSANGR